MTIASHVALLGAVTMAAGVAMSRLGLHTGMLKLRRPERRCPACGRLTEKRTCVWCTGLDE
jgi:hypothetical protein